MNAFLLDVNVLAALVWAAHESHDVVQRWFARSARRGWATCPFTQAGFVRVLSSPAFSRDALTPEEATRLLGVNLQHRFHRFWPAAIGYREALDLFHGRPTGHRQVTDAYLLGLALHHRGRLATLDRAIAALLPEQDPRRARVECISA